MSAKPADEGTIPGFKMSDVKDFQLCRKPLHRCKAESLFA